MRKYAVLGSFVFVFLSMYGWANVISTGQVVYPGVSIASGGTTSATVSTSGMQLVGCQIPALFTGTSISFTAATTKSAAFQELDNSSGKVSYTVAQGKFISINPADFAAVQYFKIVSNSSEGANRTLFCSMKGM